VKAVLLHVMVVLVLAVGSVSAALAEGGADSAGQGTRPDVLGSRVDGVWPGSYGSPGYAQGPIVRGHLPAGCTYRRNGTIRCR
jgi:hypothetical protein